MAPITPSQPKQSPVIFIAIVVAGIVGGYFYYAQVLKQEAPPIQAGVAAADTLSKFKNLKLNFTVLDDSRFKSLKIFGESPVQPGATGRSDIFAPF